MSLGFDVEKDNRTFEKDGITGEVRRFSKELEEFPNLVIVSKPENPVLVHRLKVLPNMFANATRKEGEADSISVYFNQGDKTVRLGKIFPRQVKAFLRLFDGNIIVGMLNEHQSLEGEYLYVLSD